MAAKINIGDTWKSVSSMKINVGDVWKDVNKAWININDVWKEFYSNASFTQEVILAVIHNTTTPNVFISYNTGTNWSSGTTISTMEGTTARNLKISPIGFNMVVVRNSSTPDNITFLSKNKGVSWSANTLFDGYMWALAQSDNGSAIYASNYVTSGRKVYYSTDSGSTFLSKDDIMGRTRGLDCSSDGRVVVAINNVTNNTGIFSLNYFSGSTGGFTQPWFANSIAIDETGYRWYMGPFNSGFTVATSTNSGSTWTQNHIVSGLTGQYVNICCSNNGQYVFAATHNNSHAFVSYDYGTTYTRVLSGATFGGYSQSMNYNGKYMAIGSDTTNGQYWLSKDYGTTWNSGNTGYAAITSAVAIQSKYYTDNNILNTKTWLANTSGSCTGFNQNGDGNTRDYYLTPFGHYDVVWQSLYNDATSDGDGGWNTPNITIDKTKKYRYSVWLNRKVLGNGTAYVGINCFDSTSTNVGVYNRATLTLDTNPYFWTGTGTIDTWELYVGVIHPEGTGTGSLDPDNGRYSTSGTKIGGLSNDFIFHSGTTYIQHRAYLFYSTDSSTNMRWYRPRLDLMDGTQPTIQQLIDDLC